MNYKLIRSSRRTLAIQIQRDGKLVVRAPQKMSVAIIERFITEKRSWIEKHKQLLENKWQKVEKKEYTDREIQEMKTRLQQYLNHRIPELWAWKNLPAYTSIKITKSEQRWWSCSGKNWLCFSYRLAEFLSSWGMQDLLVWEEWTKEDRIDLLQSQNEKSIKFIDAIIIHELAHLREKNHQQSFWDLVYSMMPEYENIIKQSKNIDSKE